MVTVNVEKNLGVFAVKASFEAPEKGVTALFGSSGAGKSSVINMVAGLMRPDSGDIRVNGRCLFDREKGIDLPPEKRRIGYVFQDGRLFPHLSVKSNLVYGMRHTPPDKRYVSMDQAVALLGIEHLLERRPAKLSGGEKQRVAIGRALLTSPSLLLMDEPLASLDDSRKAEVLPFIANMANEFEIPIFYVSHAWDEVATLADNLVIVEDGKVAAAGRTDDLMARRDLQQTMKWTDNGVLFDTVVDCHEVDITRLCFAGGTLKVPKGSWPIGSHLRIRVQPHHVAIALTRPEGTSFQNILPATVETVTENSNMFADVRLDVGTPLMARITTKTLAELDLKPGQKVFALVRMWECRRQPWSGMSVVPGGGFGRAAGKKCRCG